eukprot:CAMPEP_0170077144 /NCGR_PEP_ID=MMETSP0019_2-20121128/14017_1 /TAXON_ID=98059 /ORGANISM="Dinobryon sp., Strain UTEXLB2267" /LENGTH=53 /DNA_ID=CAMNT_0010289291 /DNA_START=490 /DNA_END=651 /DNA_ORIENTATION=-
MASPQGQYGRTPCEVFEEVRGHFYEVRASTSACQMLEARAGQQGMQCVSPLMV